MVKVTSTGHIVTPLELLEVEADQVLKIKPAWSLGCFLSPWFFKNLAYRSVHLGMSSLNIFKHIPKIWSNLKKYLDHSLALLSGQFFNFLWFFKFYGTILIYFLQFRSFTRWAFVKQKIWDQNELSTTIFKEVMANIVLKKSMVTWSSRFMISVFIALKPSYKALVTLNETSLDNIRMLNTN